MNKATFQSFNYDAVDLIDVSFDDWLLILCDSWEVH